jgi:hypothetical protein
LYGEVRTGRFSTIIACRFDPDTRQVVSSERVTPLYRADTPGLMRAAIATQAGGQDSANEDWAASSPPAWPWCSMA